MLSNGRNNIKEKLTPEAHRCVGQSLRPLDLESTLPARRQQGCVVTKGKKAGVGGAPGTEPSPVSEVWSWLPPTGMFVKATVVKTEIIINLQ